MFKNGGVIRQVFLRKVQRVRLMKKVRKLLAVVLAMVMSMSVAVPAFAAEVVPGAVDQQEAVAVKTTESDGSGVVLLVDWTHTIGPNWKTIAAGGEVINQAGSFRTKTNEAWNVLPEEVLRPAIELNLENIPQDIVPILIPTRLAIEWLGLIDYH